MIPAASVLRVEGLGKRYRRGQPPSLGQSLLRRARAALQRGRAGDGPETKTHFWALRDVDLEVARGEMLGIVGRNGAGKTTLLRILSRVTVPTTGTVRYRGRLASLLGVGAGLHRELSGRENVYLRGALLGMPRPEIRARFDEIVDFSGLAEHLDTPVKFYSSGMNLRLAFSVAAHLRADIIILDEVLAVGDAPFREACKRKIDEVVHDGRTVLYTAHNLASVRELCSRAILLEEGRLRASGAPAEVIAQYEQLLGLSRKPAAPPDVHAAG